MNRYECLERFRRAKDEKKKINLWRTILFFVNSYMFVSYQMILDTINFENGNAIDNLNELVELELLTKLKNDDIYYYQLGANAEFIFSKGNNYFISLDPLATSSDYEKLIVANDCLLKHNANVQQRTDFDVFVTENHILYFDDSQLEKIKKDNDISEFKLMKLDTESIDFSKLTGIRKRKKLKL